MKTRSHLLVCLVLALASSALAGPGDTPQPDRQAKQAERAAQKAERAERRRIKQAQKAVKQQARSFTKAYQLPAEELKLQIETLQTELVWHDDLEEARQAAIQANKPILWVQALGDLSGLL